jgi:ATP-dependent Clp protease ATP-binding subunit ClpA
VPKINVYLSDDLAAAVRDAHVPISAVCQAALEQAVRGVNAVRATDVLPGAAATSGPFARFTPCARHVVVLAKNVAQSTPHNYIGTEHLLHGLIDEGGNLALSVLVSLDIEIDDLRAELDASMGPATAPGPEQLPFTPLLKTTLESAAREALALGHNYVGCEHLLLGLATTENGVASKVLLRMGVDHRSVKRAVIATLAGFVHARQHFSADTGQAAGAPTTAALDEIMRRIEAIEQRLAG